MNWSVWEVLELAHSNECLGSLNGSKEWHVKMEHCYVTWVIAAIDTAQTLPNTSAPTSNHNMYTIWQIYWKDG